MLIAGKTIVITGAAGGIGSAMARRFRAEGARLCLSDMEAPTALAAELNAITKPTRATRPATGRAMPSNVAAATEANATTKPPHPTRPASGSTMPGNVTAAAEPSVPGSMVPSDVIAVAANVALEADVIALVSQAEAELGPIDLFCANAGIATGQGLEASDDTWAGAWAVNVMAHVYSARAVLPRMLARGSGYLLHTASAAGLLISTGDAPYSVTKHAAVSFAEWLAATYGDRGIGVSVLCPQGVRTPMLMDGIAAGQPAALAVAATGAILDPADVAEAVLEGLAVQRFLILPHPEVAMYQQRKAADPDRWLAGVRRFSRDQPGRP